jgi:hypothetical protein
MSGMRMTKRTWLAFVVAAVLGAPSMLLASSIGASGWAVTLAGLPAMLIGSLVDRDWFYGPRDPSA